MRLKKIVSAQFTYDWLPFWLNKALSKLRQLKGLVKLQRFGTLNKFKKSLGGSAWGVGK